ncbi:uncharacterized protein LOC144092784 [Stigmatopora argus]
MLARAPRQVTMAVWHGTKKMPTTNVEGVSMSHAVAVSIWCAHKEARLVLNGRTGTPPLRNEASRALLLFLFFLLLLLFLLLVLLPQARSDRTPATVSSSPLLPVNFTPPIPSIQESLDAAWKFSLRPWRRGRMPETLRSDSELPSPGRRCQLVRRTGVPPAKMERRRTLSGSL